jgi:pimeloyl-ACP methyl ester carboxylesterase
MACSSIDFDVGVAFRSGERLIQRAWVSVPTAARSLKAVLICLPGISFDHHYWQLPVVADPSYSFAEHMSQHGYAVVAVDHLGVGASMDPCRSGPVGMTLLACGDAELSRQVRDRLATGTLDERIGPKHLPIVGVGHSMGAGLSIMAHAHGAHYSALVLLGYAVGQYADTPGSKDAHIALPDADQTLQEAIEENLELMRGITQATPDARSWTIPRERLHDMLYATDVPETVLSADRAHVSRIPALANAEVMTPGFVQPYAARVDVPVFLGFGGAFDLAPDPSAEPANYPQAPDVELYFLEGSAHAHNFAANRTRLWDRIAGWLDEVL